ALRDCIDRGAITAADGDQKLIAVLAQKLLHALDRITLIVEHVAYALDKIHVLRPVIATSATALHRLDLRKARFPKAQHMLWQIEILSYFTYRTKCIWTLVHGVSLSVQVL